MRKTYEIKLTVSLTAGSYREATELLEARILHQQGTTVRDNTLSIESLSATTKKTGSKRR